MKRFFVFYVKEVKTGYMYFVIKMVNDGYYAGMDKEEMLDSLWDEYQQEAEEAVEEAIFLEEGVSNRVYVIDDMVEIDERTAKYIKGIKMYNDCVYCGEI